MWHTKLHSDAPAGGMTSRICLWGHENREDRPSFTCLLDCGSKLWTVFCLSSCQLASQPAVDSAEHACSGQLWQQVHAWTLFAKQSKHNLAEEQLCVLNVTSNAGCKWHWKCVVPAFTNFFSGCGCEKFHEQNSLSDAWNSVNQNALKQSVARHQGIVTTTSTEKDIVNFLTGQNWFCIFLNFASKEQNSATHQFSQTHLLLFSGQKQRATGMWKSTLEHQWTVLVNHPLVGKQFHPVDMCRISQTLDRKNNSCLPILRTLSVSAGQFSFELLHGPWLQLQTRH